MAAVKDEISVALAGRLARELSAAWPAVTFTLTVELDGTTEAEAIVDYRVHYIGANGLRRPKVFKLTRRRLVPGRPTTLTRRHRFEHVSIRRIRPAGTPSTSRSTATSSAPSAST